MSGYLGKNSVQDLLQSSRERSRLKHRLSSGTKSPILRLQADEIAYRNERFLELIGGAVSEVDKTALLPSRSRYCLLIADSEGIVIESYVPEGMEAEFHRSGLVRGAVWDERVAGTNGIAMSMHVGRVLTVRGADHFHACFHEFSCSTAPLNDSQNNLIGTITLVGSARTREEERVLCEQIVRRASRQFQTRLFRNFYSDKLTGRVISRDPRSRRTFESLVACDEDGTVISHLQLWRDGARPAEHQNLPGRHISELEGVEVNLRGPVTVPPRRRVMDQASARLPSRVARDTVLGRLISEGGGLPALVDRARKLVAHRVPLLICGQPGVGTEHFARALLEDQALVTPLGMTLDAGRNGTRSDLAEALNSLEFISNYPVGDVQPTLILRNVEGLSPEAQSVLERYLDVDPSAAGTTARPPVILFTAGRPWAELEEDGAIGRHLLYLLGQAVIELPPIAQRDREAVLNNVIAEGFAEALEISDSARDILIGYHWPGNRREMLAVLREALICGNGRRINTVDLPARLLAPTGQTNKAMTRAKLREALDSTNWNVSKAARLLGKSRATINRWIASEGLHRPD
ncbi:MAG: sigma-54-dependent Fis family transcriptional regulator [Alphaproteobacteria bacterium]|nr:MAG: sigma-54-dependent Fis family transcriptional regulator [Alphaproteobacteria bacterium]